MKYLFIVTLLFFSCISCESETSTDEVEVEEIKKPKYSFTTFEQKISYCIGLDHGASSRIFFNSDKFIGKFQPKEVQIGMVEYLRGDELRFMPSAIDSIFNLYLKDNEQVDSSIVSCADGSYAYGLSEAQVLVASLVSRGIDQEVVVDLLVAGIEDGIEGNTPSVSLKEARIEVVAYYSDINREQGENFLAQNANRENIEVTESGLQYEIFSTGKGPIPNVMDSVIVHYTGRFVDGREFESTVPSMVPAKFTPLDVIKGWTEGLQLMKEGAQYRFFIPYELAYGEKGSGTVEPYSALVFDIELIQVVKYIPNN